MQYSGPGKGKKCQIGDNKTLCKAINLHCNIKLMVSLQEKATVKQLEEI